MSSARPRAAKLVQEVIDELRHANHKIEPGSARDILRSNGITLETLEAPPKKTGGGPSVA